MAKVLLVSTYDLGHQPFGLASPAAWLRADGHEVTTADVSREPLPHDAIARSDWVAFHLPMHTATRLAVPRIRAARRINPAAHLCCYGLYAPVNEGWLRDLGVEQVIGGEFEQALCDLIAGRKPTPASVVLDRLRFRVPDRTGLPHLRRYATLNVGAERRLAGYTEASRGCKHLCRHCPIVPIYEGRFRVVQRDVVLGDVRQQVEAGAGHITFGDPDFFNGPAHAASLVEAFHHEFPGISYDVTIKVEHLLKHRRLLALLRDTGCLFITSAVESFDDVVLERLAKGHTRADFIEALAATRSHGLTLTPTFVPFTPWTTLASYGELLRTVRDLDLIDAVAPIQLAIRLLIPAGSKLMGVRDLEIGRFDSEALSYQWKHIDPRVDQLAADLLSLVRQGDSAKKSRGEIFGAIWERAFEHPPDFHLPDRATIPYLTEPWYC